MIGELFSNEFYINLKLNSRYTSVNIYIDFQLICWNQMQFYVAL